MRLDLLTALLLSGGTGDPDDLPNFLVGDVKHGRDEPPTGKIRIHAKRGGLWRKTGIVDASEVEWSRLFDNDRIEVLK